MLDFGTTIFTWQSLLTLAILILLTTVSAHFSAPTGAAIRTAQDLGVDLNDQPEESAPRSRPREWLEYSGILPVLAGLLTLGFLQAVTKAVPATAGILVQFPLYAAMAAILPKVQGTGRLSIS
ncbi:TIGR00366 family protein [Paenarthrobacter sp. PH39-S1]|uniref:TIGR00366 family protein n=1 Tax=Paenarthrobacter sp. PH39-S1 TaxID=3046204 RepID=UPI0024BB1D23|nr:TIGR00366 family protein [Paenarthrobacter sp. PH39-S1]MDJ0357773.1 TIGR00366 family protein [Paenarthrobacter sp. PH39-S1]